MTEMVSVKDCASREEADTAKRLLDSAGLLCTILVDDSNMESQKTADVPEVIQVLVSEHEAASALRILGECCVSSIQGLDSEKSRTSNALHPLDWLMAITFLGGVGCLAVWLLDVLTWPPSSGRDRPEICRWTALVFLAVFFLCFTVRQTMRRNN